MREDCVADGRASGAGTLAVTLGGDGVAVAAVAPGLTDTPGARIVNTDE